MPRDVPKSDGLHIVHAERVAAEHSVNATAADEAAEPFDAAGMHHHRTGDGDDLQLLLDGMAQQRGRLADGGLDLPFGGDAVGHEGEIQAVALLGFRDHANALEADDHLVALAEVAQPAAGGAAVAHHDHGVHPLILDFGPLLADADVGAVIGGRVEIFRRAAVAFDRAEDGVAGVDRGAAELQQAVEEPPERFVVRRLYLEAEIGRVAIRASDAELLHFEAAVILHDLVEDVLHNVRVDQVAFGFDHFLDWHMNFYCSRP